MINNATNSEAINFALNFSNITSLLSVLGSGALIGLLVQGFWRWVNRPKLEVSYQNKPRWKVETVVINNVQLPAVWFRVKVENIGHSVAKNCKGKLIEIIHPDGKTERKDIDPFELRWVGSTGSEIDLKEKEYEYLNIFFVYKQIDDTRYTSILREHQIPGGNDFYLLGNLHLYPIDLTPRNINFNPERDNYFIKVTIYSDNANPITKIFKLHSAKTDEIKMSEVAEITT